MAARAHQLIARDGGSLWPQTSAGVLSCLIAAWSWLVRLAGTGSRALSGHGVEAFERVGELLAAGYAEFS